MELVRKTAQEINTRDSRTKEFCLMIILDIKNVFNSAHGRGIIEALCKIYNTKKER